MSKSSIVLVPVTVAAVLSGSAHAGIPMGSHGFDFMMVASGFVDANAPDPSGLNDITSIVMPPVGSSLGIQGIVPGSRSFSGLLEFMEDTVDQATLTFDFEAAANAFEPRGTEAFMSMGVIGFTSEYASTVHLEALLGGGGASAAFLYIVGDPVPLVFLPQGEPVIASVNLGPGSHVVAWGVAIGGGGGFADLGNQGQISFSFVPAPGSVLILGFAGLAGARRRSR